MDILGEIAYDYTPYRYGFNNPVFWQDRTGLFETYRDAFKFLESNNLKGKIYLLNEKDSSQGFVVTVIGGEFDGQSFYDFHSPLKSSKKKGGGGSDAKGELRYYDSGDDFQTGYPGQGLEILVTAGIQKLGELFTGEDVSKETAENVQLGVDLLTVVISKGKNPEKISSIFSKITPKISKQIVRRGWSKELIHQTVNQPFTTRIATNRATGNNATAYFTKSGSYIVKDNITNEVIQVSNRLDPNWIPDATIINPYIPK